MAIKTSFARWVLGAAVSAVALLSVSALAAAVPATLTQQGRILDTAGAPVASKVKIVFQSALPALAASYTVGPKSKTSP